MAGSCQVWYIIPHGLAYHSVIGCQFWPHHSKLFVLFIYLFIYSLKPYLSFLESSLWEKTQGDPPQIFDWNCVPVFSLEYFPRLPCTPLEERSRQMVSDNSQGWRMKHIQHPPPSTLSPMPRTILWQVQFLSFVDQSTLLSTGCARFLCSEGWL